MENTSVHSLADEISPLTLAFVGDGVYDLLVREHLVRKANRKNSYADSNRKGACCL